MQLKVFSLPTFGYRNRWVAWGMAFLLALSATLWLGQPSSAQFSLPDGFGQAETAGPPQGVTRYGNLEAVTVQSPLSNNTLFTIAAPTVYDRTPTAIGDQLPVEQRAQEIRAKLLLLLSRPMDPETMEFAVSQLNNVTVVDVRDTQYPRPLVLVSVTRFDADFNGQPIDQLAVNWRDTLEQELRQGLQKLPRDQLRVLQIVSGLLLLTLILAVLKYGLYRRQKQLRQQKRAISTTASEAISDPDHPEVSAAAAPDQMTQARANFLQLLQQVFSLDRQLAALDLMQWLLFWLLILAWFGGITWVYWVSPYLFDQEFRFLRGLPNLFLVWFLAGLAIRLSRRLIDRFTTSWEGPDLADFVHLGDAQRGQLRASTISQAAKGLVTVVILLVAILSALRSLGVPTASTVAIGSLVGLAITFGSQNLVKDLVNGFLILSEDQYAIGDVIDVGTAAGLVENLNLRVTQIRSAAGDLVTIPNSGITQVKNLTRSWSRVNFSIDVAYQTDPKAALAVMQTVAQALYNDPEWHDQIVSEPSVLGFDSVSHSGMTLTTWIQTEPGQQWAVGRELRLRVRQAIAENGIEIGTPRQTFALESASGEAKGLLPDHVE